MATSGNFINFSEFDTSKSGATINKDNPGAKGSSYVMVAPSFACWTRTDSTPMFGTEPKMWTNFAYYDGSSWVGVTSENSGKNTSIQFNVNYSYDTGTKTYYYNGPTTPVLFQAKRLQGNGDRTHCRWIFMHTGHAGETWYNTYMKGKKIYGLYAREVIYTASDGAGAYTPTLAQIQERLPLIKKGNPLSASYISTLSCLPRGYTG